MTKITMTIDDASIRELDQTAKRLGIPKSAVVRQAIHAFAQAPRTPDADLLNRRLEALARLRKNSPYRTKSDVETAVAEVRRSRRSGYRPGA